MKMVTGYEYKRLKTCYKDVNIIYHKTGVFCGLQYLALETKDFLVATQYIYKDTDLAREIQVYFNKPIKEIDTVDTLKLDYYKTKASKDILVYTMDILFDNDGQPIKEEWAELLSDEEVEDALNNPQEKVENECVNQVAQLALQHPSLKSNAIIANIPFVISYTKKFIDENTVAMLFTEENTEAQSIKISQRLFHNTYFLSCVLRLHYLTLMVREDVKNEGSGINIQKNILNALGDKKSFYLFLKGVDKGFKISGNKEVWSKLFGMCGIDEIIRFGCYTEGRNAWIAAQTTKHYIPYSALDKIVFRNKAIWENPNNQQSPSPVSF